MNDEFHPVANVFPLMDDAALDDLAKDIAANGLHEPIWRHKDGRIVDGRNRWLACQRAGVPCPDRTFEQGDRQLVPFVISLNQRRRHLKESQRVMVAARLATLPRGRPRSGENASIDAFTEASENKGISEPDAADLLNVSRISVQRARKVVEEGTVEMIAAVDRGRMSVSRAMNQIATATLQAKAEQAKKPAAGKGKRKPGPAKGKRARKAAASPLAQRPPELVRFTLWLRNGPG
jgi:ParB-like chromosome segregation protein Spo0J